MCVCTFFLVIHTFIVQIIRNFKVFSILIGIFFHMKWFPLWYNMIFGANCTYKMAKIEKRKNKYRERENGRTCVNGAFVYQRLFCDEPLLFLFLFLDYFVLLQMLLSIRLFFFASFFYSIRRIRLKKKTMHRRKKHTKDEKKWSENERWKTVQFTKKLQVIIECNGANLPH